MHPRHDDELLDALASVKPTWISVSEITSEPGHGVLHSLHILCNCEYLLKFGNLVKFDKFGMSRLVYS